MKIGNVYEVFQIGDRVRVKDIASFYCGRTGEIVGVEESGCYTVPIYTIRLNDRYYNFDDSHNRPREIRVNATSLEKIPRREDVEYNITMGTRNAKSMKELIEVLKEANKLDGGVYSLDTLNKLTGGTDDMKKIDVEKIIFNGFKTIVFWNDGTKTIVSMSQEERNFDPEDAFRAAYTKKMYGTNSKIKRVIAEKSNIEKWKEKEENQLYNLGLKVLTKCDDLDMEAIARATKEAEELTPEILKNMYETLTGHRYEGEKKEKVETPVSHKFKVGDGVAVSSMCSPYVGRGGKIVAITQKCDDGSIHYTVEFYEPGNPGHSYTYDFSECQLAYDPTWAWNEKSKKAADAFAAFLDTIFNCGDSSKENEDGEK